MPIRPDLRPLYRTPEYFAAREQVIRQARGCCEFCLRPRGKLVEMISGRDAAGELFLLWRIPGNPRWANGRGWLASVRDLQVLADVSTWRKYQSKTQLQMAHVSGVASDHASLKYLCAWCHLSNDKAQHFRTRCLRRDKERPLLMLMEEEFYVEPSGDLARPLVGNSPLAGGLLPESCL
jgi:hypothetical protein